MFPQNQQPGFNVYSTTQPQIGMPFPQNSNATFPNQQTIGFQTNHQMIPQQQPISYSVIPNQQMIPQQQNFPAIQGQMQYPAMYYQTVPQNQGGFMGNHF
ncbi:hypothetical protein PVAND_012343 [Polypedilum vanderplanki]|uniref:Uncharacterized protein n=1 Tax=Polypedilum vanderplanki TaxID=319348 RepID=A0A9J6CM67_POLVA|nr:hypothetical protein PVAND_012343 [Polypedilum vanderplanki]